MAKIKKDIVKTQKLAEILGITDRRIQQLVTEGVIEKQARGQYELVASVQAYIRYQIDIIKNKQATGTLLEEQTRLTKLKADHEELELEILRNETIPVTMVIEIWQKLISSARTKFMGLHSSIKTQHPEIEIPVILSVENMVRNTLDELSRDGLPDKYKKEIPVEVKETKPIKKPPVKK
jgi:phage terminase Nu1 subunit (DNA packaging protein)